MLDSTEELYELDEELFDVLNTKQPENKPENKPKKENKKLNKMEKLESLMNPDKLDLSGLMSNNDISKSLLNEMKDLPKQDLMKLLGKLKEKMNVEQHEFETVTPQTKQDIKEKLQNKLKAKKEMRKSKR